MYQTPAPPGDPLAVEAVIALQSAGSDFPLWMVVLGACSVLVGTAAVLRRRTRSTPPEPTAVRSPDPTPPVPTDEERVVRLLELNEGRMRQTRIVERTGWSKSKVSMLLSEMEADGTVHKLRVGRENIISLPGAEPALAHPGDDREP